MFKTFYNLFKERFVFLLARARAIQTQIIDHNEGRHQSTVKTVSIFSLLMFVIKIKQKLQL